MTSRPLTALEIQYSNDERPKESLKTPLKGRKSSSSTRQAQESSDDDLAPECVPALLQRHLQDNKKEESAHRQSRQEKISTGPFSMLTAAMVRSPLIMRSSPGLGKSSYGATPTTSTNLIEEEDGGNTEPTSRQQQNDSREQQFVTSDTGGRPRKSMDLASGTSTDIQVRTSNLREVRKSMSGPSSGLEVGTEVGTETGLQIRYSAGGLPIIADVVTTKQGTCNENFQGSESSRKNSEDAESDDDTSTNNDEDPPDNSPYVQVRASVSAQDDTTLSINTPRMWMLSILFTILGSSTNLFFSLRYPSVTITPVIALLLVHPLGLLWDRLLKRRTDPDETFVDGVLGDKFSTPIHAHLDVPSASLMTRVNREVQNGPTSSTPKNSCSLRLRLWLAQGSWNEKEHACVYISSNVSFGFAYATDVIVEQTHFYNQDVSITYQVLLILSTQILGYTFAGLTRRFLVRPGGMIWPGTLMSAAMFNTLHKEENTIANGWRISRWKFFFTVWTAAFFFYFLPGLLMPALSYFSVVTWFAPDNVVVANLFGVSSGLGLFPVTFDWAQIAYIGSPLLTPFWAAMNVIGGLVIVMWIIAPISYYSNIFYSAYMPILSSAVFDNTGNLYDVSKILTPNFLFDREAYQNYSRVFLPVTYVLSYGLQFAALSSLLTHTVCWHGGDIWKQWRRSLKEIEGKPESAYESISSSNDTGRGRSSSNGGEHLRLRRTRDVSSNFSQEDVHNRLMKRYKDAPRSWYILTFVSMTAIGIFVVEYYPVHLPWYGLLLALSICAILFIPIGIVMAITNQQSSIYLICQLICGALFPGRPVANMVFVNYGYISSSQGLKFSADLKLGHYMKIPPRILFAVQMVATVIASVTQIAVLNWMFLYVPNICTPQALNGFTCPIARVHFNGSILWGVVGPSEFFGKSATYRPLVWCFLLGAIGPVPLWLYARYRKHSIIRKINLPVLFGSLSWIPPATGLNFSVWAVVCYIFNYVIKRRAEKWWVKYTMTLSAALDSSLAVGLVIIFFGFVYPGWMEGFRWWGTEVYKQGCDWRACSYKTVPAGEHFGPDSW